MSEGETCAVDGCDRPVKCRGLCQAHYFRLRRTGSVGSAAIWDRKRARCSVDDCDRPVEARGMCLLHDRRMQKHGDPSAGGLSHYGETNPAWRGDAVGYVSAHERVRVARGVARDHLCQCGARARHWAYQHTDPNESVTPAGIPYSPDPSHYLAMCVPCHKAFDLRHRAEAVA